MSAVSHNKSLTMADFAATVTVFNSQASTTTIAATDLARPSNWNSAHDQFITLSGNTSNLSSAGPISNIILAGGNDITLSMATAVGVASITFVASGDIMSRFTEWGIPGGSTAASSITNSASFRAMLIDQPISFTRVDFGVSVSLSSAVGATFGRVITSAFVIYTRNASTLSPLVGAIGTTTYTWASNTANFNSVNGGRLVSFPISTVLTPGEYWAGFQMQTATSVSSGTVTFALFPRVFPTAPQFTDFGVSSSVASTDFQAAARYSGTISATNQTIAVSDLNFTDSQPRANIAFMFRAN